ncbi:hypothetical protein [Rhodovulum adriaticum]|uniref:Antitoxin Xre/MbcA/ParS-like toxin-binding domain-containing protein n=1 Tax=Rhodovulum adriaticum TaxID=35804 RepID=A0A4R2NG68_RHOAD|nr:hypothetical protein [Rhodovulum adriaticum]MBK1636871.1 hypothetical protein [Rhodovulum adriaticum]TCP20280.1 hypothetical protein EV656_12114 [Rhodovulum adriaticum]
MTHDLQFIDEKTTQSMPLDLAMSRLEHGEERQALLVSFTNPAIQAAAIKLVGLLQKQAPNRLRDLSEDRINAILDSLVALDPRAAAEARIDLRNAEKRKEFLDEFAVIDSARVHEISGNKGSNPSQTAAVWRKANRILGLPVGQRTVYPAFQFDEGGRPYPLMKRVLDALPDDMTPWQTAFWLVSPSSALDGGLPLDAIRRGDEQAVDAARNEASEIIG